MCNMHSLCTNLFAVCILIAFWGTIYLTIIFRYLCHVQTTFSCLPLQILIYNVMFQSNTWCIHLLQHLFNELMLLFCLNGCKYRKNSFIDIYFVFYKCNISSSPNKKLCFLHENTNDVFGREEKSHNMYSVTSSYIIQPITHLSLIHIWRCRRRG